MCIFVINIFVFDDSIQLDDSIESPSPHLHIYVEAFRTERRLQHERALQARTRQFN